MNDLKVVAQVMETTDYSIFKPSFNSRLVRLVENDYPEDYDSEMSFNSRLVRLVDS